MALVSDSPVRMKPMLHLLHQLQDGLMGEADTLGTHAGMRLFAASCPSPECQEQLSRVLELGCSRISDTE